MNESTDGYSGAQQILRDTRGKTGGTAGTVNCASYTRTIAGKDVKQFEWNALMILDNYAAEGENVALYAQANKYASGPTWGACIEASDTTEDASALVGVEVDCWVTGPDNGQRIGIDVVVGDSKLIRGVTSSPTSQASVGLRIGSSLVSPKSSWTTGISLQGNISTGIDLTLASTTKAIKLRAGQGILVGKLNLVWLIYTSLILSTISLFTIISKIVN